MGTIDDVYKVPYTGNDPLLEFLAKDKDNHWIKFIAYIDSGAFMTILTKNDASDLGIDLTKGKKLDLHGVGGTVLAYVHKVEIRIVNEIIKLEIAFSTSNETPRLIGRSGIFVKFKICFNDKVKNVSFSS